MNLRAFAFGAALVLLGAGGARALEFVQTAGVLSDADFYRAVACGAAPGAPCAKPFTRWPAAKALDLSVTISDVHPDFPSYKRELVDSALQEAVDEINNVGAAVQLHILPSGSAADIPIYLTGARRGGLVDNTGFLGLDGSTIQAGLVTLWWRDGVIRSSGIALSKDLRRRSTRSVLLEELVQSLGLATDLRNPSYAGKTIFDEDSNAVTRLIGQDAQALRLHYPRSGSTSNASE